MSTAALLKAEGKAEGEAKGLLKGKIRMLEQFLQRPELAAATLNAMELPELEVAFLKLQAEYDVQFKPSR